MKEIVNFHEPWSTEQIEALIELRFKDFKDMNESDDDEWEIMTKEWNALQEYEVFHSKQLKVKLQKLYKEYLEIQNSLDETEEKEIDLPRYWSTMVEYMPLTKNNFKSSSVVSSSKKRKPESTQKKILKKSKVPLMESSFDDGLENVSPVKSLKSQPALMEETQISHVQVQQGLEKIAGAIEKFGNIIMNETAGYNARFENILLNQQKLLQFSLEQISKQLSERIDSGMNQIIDILSFERSGNFRGDK